METVDRQALVDTLAHEVGKLNSSLVGRAWEVADPKQRLEFAEWFVDLAERLGFEMWPKE